MLFDGVWLIREECCNEFSDPGPLQIDPEWMTCALRRAGAIRGTKVVEMTCKPVGNGVVGDSYRFGLAYEEVEPDAPARVIGKFPAADPDSRRSGSAHLLYLREVSFYLELAHTLPIQTPRPLRRRYRSGNR